MGCHNTRWGWHRFLSVSSSVVMALEDKREVMAAIMAAVNAYLEEEERARLVVAEARPHAPISLWRVFGRREAMRPRAAWRRRMV